MSYTAAKHKASAFCRTTWRERVIKGLKFDPCNDGDYDDDDDDDDDDNNNTKVVHKRKVYSGWNKICLPHFITVMNSEGPVMATGLWTP
jgi:hypothetical protein